MKRLSIIFIRYFLLALKGGALATVILFYLLIQENRYQYKKVRGEIDRVSEDTLLTELSYAKSLSTAQKSSLDYALADKLSPVVSLNFDSFNVYKRDQKAVKKIVSEKVVNEGWLSEVNAMFESFYKGLETRELLLRHDIKKIHERFNKITSENRKEFVSGRYDIINNFVSSIQKTMKRSSVSLKSKLYIQNNLYKLSALVRNVDSKFFTTKEQVITETALNGDLRIDPFKVSLIKQLLTDRKVVLLAQFERLNAERVSARTALGLTIALFLLVFVIDELRARYLKVPAKAARVAKTVSKKKRVVKEKKPVLELPSIPTPVLATSLPPIPQFDERVSNEIIFTFGDFVTLVMGELGIICQANSIALDSEVTNEEAEVYFEFTEIISYIKDVIHILGTHARKKKLTLNFDTEGERVKIRVTSDVRFTERVLLSEFDVAEPLGGILTKAERSLKTYDFSVELYNFRNIRNRFSKSEVEIIFSKSSRVAKASTFNTQDMTV